MIEVEEFITEDLSFFYHRIIRVQVMGWMAKDRVPLGKTFTRH